jgi:hypothetical protein
VHKRRQTATELLGKMRNSTENKAKDGPLSESSVPLLIIGTNLVSDTFLATEQAAAACCRFFMK